MPGKRPKIRSAKIQLWVEPEVKKRWEELARKEERTLSQWIRKKCAKKGDYADPYKLHAPIANHSPTSVSDSSSHVSSLNSFPANASTSLRLGEDSNCSPVKPKRGRPRKESQSRPAPLRVTENVAAAVQRLTHHEDRCLCAVCEEWRRRMSGNTH